VSKDFQQASEKLCTKKGCAIGTALFIGEWSALAAHLGEALATIDRTVRLRLKGNLGLAATGGADSGEILAGTTSSGLAGIAAGLATLRLILEPALSIEFLLTGGEHELLATLFAN